MAVYANILGNWTELGDNSSIEDMVPEQYVNEVLTKTNISTANTFVNVSHDFNDYVLHISQIQSQQES